MIYLSHPTGNANVRAVLNALENRHASYRFHTTLALSGQEWFMRCAPSGIRAELARRIYSIPLDRTRMRPWREMCRLSLGRVLKSLTSHEKGWASVDEVYKDLDAFVSRGILGDKLNSPELVYCYEDCALETFRAAKSVGAACWYDLPIAYWETVQNLLREEAERLPEWEQTLGGTRDSRRKLDRKTEELSLADTVVCPSQFVYDSLPRETHLAKRCIIAEFGSPIVTGPAPQREVNGGRLRVLFAGALTQRKGLADLFAAMRMLSRRDIELVVMGSLAAPMRFYKEQLGELTYEPPRPHHRVLELMKSCDVFVLPSIVEGRALVQQEALSCGLPLIVTRNTGGEDLIDEGRTGFIVPIRSPEAIAQKITWFADHRKEIPGMSEASRQKAAAYTWDRYGAKIFNAMSTFGEPIPA